MVSERSLRDVRTAGYDGGNVLPIRPSETTRHIGIAGKTKMLRKREATSVSSDQQPSCAKKVQVQVWDSVVMYSIV